MSEAAALLQAMDNVANASGTVLSEMNVGIVEMASSLLCLFQDPTLPMSSSI